jgi:1-acyl-sn-glycerol-3-phosphate acyltransferase
MRALFRVRVSGDERLPTGGGWILCGVPHRTWIEPVLAHALLGPSGARMVTVADARTVTRAWWRTAASSLVGGVIPVGSGGSSGFQETIAAAASALSIGDIVVIFPEVGPPSRPPQLRRLSSGVAHIAAAAGAQVVPVVFGGTDELYLGRRIEVRVLPSLQPPGRLADRAEITAWTAHFRSVTQAEASSADAAATSRPPRTKRLRWLSGPYPRAD